MNFEQENAKYARIASNFGSTPEFAYSSLPTSLFYFEYRPVRSVAIGSAKANSPEHKTYRSMPKKNEVDTKCDDNRVNQKDVAN